MFKKLFKKKKEEERTKVGVGVMIFKDGKVLLGKRKGSHGAGEYSFPGGHLEYLEGFEECARRETLEESGIEIKNVKFLWLKNTAFYTPKHYVHIGLIADWESGEPKNLEPEKCEGWDWYDLNNLPKPLFRLSETTFEAYKLGKNYYDKE
jgi:8-oxo-dGTP diphosphatase